MKINVLDKKVADKIAAGEVIDQPLSVVKELVENSIDAASSLIVIEIKNGGKSYIRVSDNGCGIEDDDIKTAFLPHATSKIKNLDDLNNILSLGFRGEALTSVAAVSKLELSTKTNDKKIGRKIYIEESDIISFEETACETGTSIIVKDLFFNLPARQKFLKSDSREGSYIIDFVSKIAICYPNIKFRMINDGVILFSTSGKNDLYNTILSVYNAQNVRRLLKVDYKRDGMTITGYTSSPLESKQNKKQQIYFVNGRLVSSKIIDNAISMAYEDKLFEGRYPSTYLFLNLNPKDVDVNVHPRKAEVKFKNDDFIRDFIIEGLRTALLDKEATSISKEEVKIQKISLDPVNYIKEEIDDNIYSESKSNIIYKNTDDIFKDLRKDEEKELVQVQGTHEQNISSSIKTIEFQERFIEDNKDNENNSDKYRFRFSSLKPVSQIFVTYILATDTDNFYIIDQHAAHERVMFERLLKKFNDEENIRQDLLTPFVIDLSPSEFAVSNESLPILDSLGFNLEEFGNTSYIIKSIPAYLSLSEAEEFLNTYFEAAEEVKDKIQIRKDEIISKSCKSAVKAHDKLSNSEIVALFNDLDKCENPFSCPHGRPTFIKLSEYELERMFKRK